MTHEEKSKSLSSVQKLFVEEYLKDPSDGGAAYQRANPNSKSKKAASVAASKLLRMPKIQEALRASAKDILGVLEALIIQNVEFWLEILDDKEGRSADRMKASEYLGKYMQMFIEKKEVDISGKVQIVDNIPNG